MLRVGPSKDSMFMRRGSAASSFSFPTVPASRFIRLRVMKIVLAYSGGLDTSVILSWLKETYDAELIAFCADVGQEEELDGLEAKALRPSASKRYIDDLREEFGRVF